jgi:hypothetical protein
MSRVADQYWADEREMREHFDAQKARIAELTMMLRDVHDPLLISEALLRKHGYPATADMVKEVYDKLCTLVPAGPMQ